MRTSVKTCFKCGAERPLTEFYVHRQMGDGRLNKCKECTRNDVRENYAKRLDYYREYDRRRGRRPAEPLKASARRKVRDALARAILKRGPCEVGVDCHGRIEGHHDDYTKPLAVRWLCKKHHAEAHTRKDH